MTTEAVLDNPKPARIPIGEKVKIKRRGKKGIWHADFHHNGDHRRRTLKTRNEKEARRRAIRLEAQLLDGNLPSRKAVAKSMEEAIKDFQAAKKVEGRSTGTLVRYQTELQQFAQFAEEHRVRTLNKITLVLHDQYLAHRRKGLAPKTLYDNMILLRTFLRWCCRRKWILENPLDGCDLKKPKPREHMAPTLEQVYQLLARAEEPYYTILLTLSLTGMRSGELQHLRLQDVDLENDRIHLECREDWRTKNGEDRHIPIHPQLKPYLAALPKHKRPYLIWNPPTRNYPQGREQLDQRHLNEMAQRLAQAASIPVGRKHQAFCIHSLRHFFETHCVHAGVPQPVIDNWMGHSDQAMSRIYYQLHQERSQEYMRKLPFETQAAPGVAVNQEEPSDRQENDNG